VVLNLEYTLDCHSGSVRLHLSRGTLVHNALVVVELIFSHM